MGEKKTQMCAKVIQTLVIRMINDEVADISLSSTVNSRMTSSRVSWPKAIFKAQQSSL